MKPDYYAMQATLRMLQEETNMPNTPGKLAAVALNRMAAYRNAAIGSLDHASKIVLEGVTLDTGGLRRGGRARITESRTHANNAKGYLETVVYWDGIYQACMELLKQDYDPDNPLGVVWDAETEGGVSNEQGDHHHA